MYGIVKRGGYSWHDKDRQWEFGVILSLKVIVATSSCCIDLVCDTNADNCILSF